MESAGAFGVQTAADGGGVFRCATPKNRWCFTGGVESRCFKTTFSSFFVFSEKRLPLIPHFVGMF